FEPLPPLIIDKDNGFTIQMLKDIEKKTDLKFIITIMPYNRAKYLLKTGEIDLAGHTPYQMETPDFYEYAVDVDWHVTTKIDIYGTKLEDLVGETYKSFKKIGTPRGNEDFFSEMFAIPNENFYVGELGNLVKMVQAKRIDVLLFERSASMSTIQKLNISNINYKMIDDSVKASFAVNKNSNGIRLKALLENAIKMIDQKSIFKDFFRYTQLPDQGTVTP
ncbi:MAG: hypothetical protein KKE61_18875, partial [Proteobacteria bacterium]|nr:hypothetical protein [Pseudomonadota bacterium]